jgi:hypothetical protein
MQRKDWGTTWEHLGSEVRLDVGGVSFRPQTVTHFRGFRLTYERPLNEPPSVTRGNMSGLDPAVCFSVMTEKDDYDFYVGFRLTQGSHEHVNDDEESEK